MAGPYPPHYGAGPVGPPPPHPGPPQPYPENPLAAPTYPGMLPPPVAYPKRSRWRPVLAALAVIAVVAVAVVVTVLVMRADDNPTSGKLTTAAAQSAIQDYLDALQRDNTEKIARHTLCGLFDDVKDKKSDLALADLSSDAFRKQFTTAQVTSIDKMVFSSPNQAQVLFTMRVTPTGTRTQPPPKVQEQAVAQLLAEDHQVLVCSYLLRAGAQY
jgi:hypothetical protein